MRAGNVCGINLLHTTGSMRTTQTLEMFGWNTEMTLGHVTRKSRGYLTVGVTMFLVERQPLSKR